MKPWQVHTAVDIEINCNIFRLYIIPSVYKFYTNCTIHRTWNHHTLCLQNIKLKKPCTAFHVPKYCARNTSMILNGNSDLSHEISVTDRRESVVGLQLMLTRAAFRHYRRCRCGKSTAGVPSSMMESSWPLTIRWKHRCFASHASNRQQIIGQSSIQPFSLT